VLQGVWTDLSRRQKISQYASLAISEEGSHYITGPKRSYSFGDVTLCHSMLCLFVLGSKWWNWLSVPVTTFSMKQWFWAA
jgi:hypothetical protein